MEPNETQLQEITRLVRVDEGKYKTHLNSMWLLVKRMDSGRADRKVVSDIGARD
jgi:hypothetical protein